MSSAPWTEERATALRRKADCSARQAVEVARNASIAYAFRRYTARDPDFTATEGYVFSANVDTARRQPIANKLPTRADDADVMSKHWVMNDGMNRWKDTRIMMTERDVR